VLKTSPYKPNKTMVSVTYSRASGRKRDARRRGPRPQAPTADGFAREPGGGRPQEGSTKKRGGLISGACARPCAAAPSLPPTWNPHARVAVGAPTSSRHRARCLLVFFFSFPFQPDARIWICGSRDVLHPIKCALERLASSEWHVILTFDSPPCLGFFFGGLIEASSG